MCPLASVLHAGSERPENISVKIKDTHEWAKYGDGSWEQITGDTSIYVSQLKEEIKKKFPRKLAQFDVDDFNVYAVNGTEPLNSEQTAAGALA